MPLDRQADPSAYCRAPQLLAEALERRVMLASALGAPYGGKFQPQLLSIVQSQHAPLVDETSSARFDTAGNVQVELRVRGDLDETIGSLAPLGARFGARDDASGRIEIWAAPAQLAAISALDAVSSIRLPDYRVTRAGGVNTAGDAILNADKVRSQFAFFGINGSGMKIGVISDGVDHRGNVGNDLSPINIDPQHPGRGDEGTAMLEIIHDLAPGAQLYFSGPDTSLQMIDSVGWLVSQGCNVIVDDLGFYQEPLFNDGPIAQAVQNAINAGVVYVSAAGNESTPPGELGSFHYQRVWSPAPAEPEELPLHDFLDGLGVDRTMNVVVTPGHMLNLVLQWSDPFGASANDYDLYLYGDDGMTELLESATLPQSGAHDPVEQLTWTNTGGAERAVRIVIQKFSGLPRELELFGLGEEIRALQYSTPGDAIFGQGAVPGAITVGAIDATAPGANQVEGYSSQGPSTIYANFAPQQKFARNSLSGVAVDGVLTRAGQLGYLDGDPLFFGTSAAAPHAAAIAALVKETNPNLSPQQIRNIMQETAVDLVAYGPGYDPVSGAGRYNALDAVYKAFTPPAIDLLQLSDSGSSAIDNLTNDITPSFSGIAPAGAFVALYQDNSAIPVATLQLPAAQTAFNVTAPALSDGQHVFHVRVGSSNTGPLSNASPGLTVTIDTTPPAARAAPDLSAGSDSGVSSTDNITRILNPQFFGNAEPMTIVKIFAGGNSIGTASPTMAGGGWSAAASFLGDGTHAIVAVASDLAGNSSAASLPLSIVIDRTPPAMTPLGFEFQSGQSLLYSLSEDVGTSLHGSDLRLRRQPGNIPSGGQIACEVTQTLEQYQACFTFSGEHGMLADGDYTATIESNAVIDLAGNQLAATAPANFFVFCGDANRDRRVNALDFNALATHFGQADAQFSGGDFNCDGTVTTGDFSALAANFNKQLLPPQPPSGTLIPAANLAAADLFGEEPILESSLPLL